MQLDFHYYATYCAAFIAGYTHGESLEIAYSAQFTDCCSETLLESINAPKNAATTQLQTELMNSGTDLVSRQKDSPREESSSIIIRNHRMTQQQVSIRQRFLREMRIPS